MSPKRVLVSWAHKILKWADKNQRHFEQSLFAAIDGEMGRLTNEPQPPPSGVDLVLGMATNYKREHLAPFILSLRRHGYRGDIVLLVSKVDEDTRAFFNENNVTTRYYWDGHFIAAERLMARYFSFYRILRDLLDSGRTYDRVLISDTRDVVFQGDPFVDTETMDIGTFQEEESVTVADCRYNSTWVRQGYGQKGLKAVGGQPIVNAGTVMGSGPGIMRLLLLLQAESFRHADAARLRPGVDQAALNVLTAREGIPSYPNGEHIWTLGYVAPEEVIITAERKVTDSHGRLCPILHQYDRHPALVALVQSLYGTQAVITETRLSA